MTLSSQKIEYSNCRSLPIKCYSFVETSNGKEATRWPHRGVSEILFGDYVNSTTDSCKLRVEFLDGTFVYVTKK